MSYLKDGEGASRRLMLGAEANNTDADESSMVLRTKSPQSAEMALEASEPMEANIGSLCTFTETSKSALEGTSMLESVLEDTFSRDLRRRMLDSLFSPRPQTRMLRFNYHKSPPSKERKDELCSETTGASDVFNDSDSNVRYQLNTPRKTPSCSSSDSVSGSPDHRLLPKRSPRLKQLKQEMQTSLNEVSMPNIKLESDQESPPETPNSPPQLLSVSGSPSPLKSAAATSMKHALKQKWKQITEPPKSKNASPLNSDGQKKAADVLISRAIKPQARKVDAFRFLRQTSSGRIVKRTRLASTDVTINSQNSDNAISTSSPPPETTEMQPTSFAEAYFAELERTKMQDVKTRVENQENPNFSETSSTEQLSDKRCLRKRKHAKDLVTETVPEKLRTCTSVEATKTTDSIKQESSCDSNITTSDPLGSDGILGNVVRKLDEFFHQTSGRTVKRTRLAYTDMTGSPKSSDYAVTTSSPPPEQTKMQPITFLEAYNLMCNDGKAGRYNDDNNGEMNGAAGSEVSTSENEQDAKILVENRENPNFGETNSAEQVSEKRCVRKRKHGKNLTAETVTENLRACTSNEDTKTTESIKQEPSCDCINDTTDPPISDTNLVNVMEEKPVVEGGAVGNEISANSLPENVLTGAGGEPLVKGEQTSEAVVLEYSNIDPNSISISEEIRKKKHKHNFLARELEVLLAESAKVAKLSGTGTPKARLRQKSKVVRKRTECEQLLDSLMDCHTGQQLANLQTRNGLQLRKLPYVINKGKVVKLDVSTPDSDQQKSNETAVEKLQKKKKVFNSESSPPSLVQNTSRKNSSSSVERALPVHTKTKTNVSALLVQKKKAIKMQLNLEKKKAEKTKQKGTRHGKHHAVQNNLVCSEKAAKKIMLKDLQNKVKAKLTPSSSPTSLSPIQINGGAPAGLQWMQPVNMDGPVLSPSAFRMYPQQTTMQSAVAAHCSNTQSVLAPSFLFRVPVISLTPTQLPNSLILSTCPPPGVGGGANKKVKSVLKKKMLDAKDLKRSSVRQAESAYKYKDIAVKVQKNYTQILLMPNSKVKNGLNPQVLHELKLAFNAAKKDPNCKIVLLSSTGSMFCSGIDLRYLIKENKEQRQKAVMEMVLAMKEFLRILITFPRPVVVAVNGAAIGLGVTMLLLCDIVYASDKATFYTPYAKLNQVPEGCASLMMPKLMNMALAGDMLFGNRRLTAEEAQHRGLVSQVFWPDMLLEEVIPRVKQMATQNLHAMEATKSLLRQRLKTELELALENECQLLMHQWFTPDCQRAMKSLLEKEEII